MQDDRETQGRHLSGLRDMVAALWGLFYRDRWIFAALLGGLMLTEGALRWGRPALAGLVYSADMTGGHPIAFDADGFRIPPRATPSTAPVKVLALGDSTTYGTGVAAAETWPLVLQARLGAGVDVRNGGLEGAGLNSFAPVLSGPWQQTPPPDVVVLLTTGNMVSFTDFRWDAADRDPRDRIRPGRAAGGLKRHIRQGVQSSALWKAVVLHMEFAKYGVGLLDHRVDPAAPLSPLMAYGWAQPDVDPTIEVRMWQRFETSLEGLQAQMVAQGSCLVLGFLPPRFLLGDSPLDNLKFVPRQRLRVQAHARVQEMAEALGVPFIPVEAALRATRQTEGAFEAPLYIPGDYTHLDAQGHAIVADRFAQELASVLQGDIPCAAVQ